MYTRELGSADKLRPGQFYLLNIGDFGSGGTHWVLLYRPSSRTGTPPQETANDLIYFDSFGVIPGQSVQEYHHRTCDGRLLYQDADLQHYRSHRCGAYCVYVADMLRAGKRFTEIVNSFLQNGNAANELVIRSYFRA